MRVFATYATWDNEWEGQVGGSAFAEETSGMTYGMQMEVWWLWPKRYYRQQNVQ